MGLQGRKKRVTVDRRWMNESKKNAAIRRNLSDLSRSNGIKVEEGSKEGKLDYFIECPVNGKKVSRRMIKS